MRTVDARTGVQTLDEEECRALLAAQRVGRVAVVDGYSPLVFPVNYQTDGDDIVFRVAAGTKLAATGRSNASFEIDAFDVDRRSGWSVLAVGRLEEVTPFDPAFARLDGLPVEPWAEGAHPHILRLVPTRITGRRVGVVDP